MESVERKKEIMKDLLGDRMKQYYEVRSQTYLTRKVPVIIRLDGCHFHTLTRYMEKPFDKSFIWRMYDTAHALVNNIQGCKIGYVQSDEISLLLTDFDRLETQAWFDYNVQKIVSVSASMASTFFNTEVFTEKGYFDARAFNIPKEEVTNYFIWRQKDCQRNSLNAFAQSFFSSKELLYKKSVDKHRMLQNKGQDWYNLDEHIRNGYSIADKVYTCEFKENRYITDQIVYGESENT